MMTLRANTSGSDRETGTVERLVAVKPLEWRTFCTASGNCEAKTPFGEYVIQSETDGWCLYLLNEQDAHTAHSTLEYAQATAEADYTSRTLSALVLSESTRLKARAEKAEGLFSECQLARDEAGFLGSVPECIKHLEAEAEALAAKLATAREALEQTQAFLERLIAMASGGADMSDANLAMNMNAVLDLIHAAITEGADHERS